MLVCEIATFKVARVWNKVVTIALDAASVALIEDILRVHARVVLFLLKLILV